MATVLITGAGSGIGLATTDICGASRARHHSTTGNLDSASELARLGGIGDLRVQTLALDVDDDGPVARVFIDGYPASALIRYRPHPAQLAGTESVPGVSRSIAMHYSSPVPRTYLCARLLGTLG